MEHTIEIDPSEIKRFTNPHVSRETIRSILGFKPRNIDIYRQSLVHKSVLRLIRSLPPVYQVPKYMMESNERLEFLGDSIISCITATYLYQKYTEDEGFLTRIRSKLVDTRALSNFAKKINLENNILMSKHLQSLDGRNKEKMLENAYEAWVGAIFLDMGLEYARKFVIGIYEEHVDWNEIVKDTNYKDQILRYCQSENLEMPVYTIIKTEGPPHDRNFTIGINIGGTDHGVGTGKQKKEGEQSAAKMALRNLKVI